MGMKRYLQTMFLGAASVLSGCDAGSSEEGTKTLEVIINSSETDDNGLAKFWDKDSNEEVLIEALDVNDRPVSDINVRFLDGSSFEGFVLSDPDLVYATTFKIYPHNSFHGITMYVGDSEPVVRMVMTDSLEGRTLQNFERDYLKPRAIYLGIRTPDELNTQTRNKLFLLGSFSGADTVFSLFTETVARLSDLAGWNEPKFYKVYEILKFDGITTSLMHLIPVNETTEETPEAQGERNSLLENTKIAFMSKYSRWDDFEIYVMNSDGSNIRNLTNDPRRDRHPCWSSDGSKIAFDSERGENDGIYVMNSDGSNQRHLTNGSNYDENPLWSSNGMQIVFESVRNGNIEICIMNSDGSNRRNLTNNPAHDENPSWSPNGRQIAFQSRRDGNWEIYVMNLDGSNQRNLTNNPEYDGSPSWSPDGRQIAFRSDRDGNREIYVMNLDGSNQRNLTNSSGWDNYPSWSPDGRQIVFMSERDGNPEIYVMNSDGSNQRNLTNNSAYDSHPAWSPFMKTSK